MTCLQLRRQLLTDPKAIDGLIRRHIRTCHTCRLFVEDVIRFESRLEKALNVAVPADLAPRIIVKQSFTRARPRRKIRHRLLIAASFLLIGVIAAGTVYWPQTRYNDTELQAEILTHVTPDTFTYAALVPQEQIRTVLDAITTVWRGEENGLTMPVIYAENCKIAGRKAAHLVLQTNEGPVTAFVIPHIQARPAAAQPDWPGQWYALNHGALAVIADTATAANHVSRQLKLALQVNAI